MNDPTNPMFQPLTQTRIQELKDQGYLLPQNLHDYYKWEYGDTNDK